MSSSCLFPKLLAFVYRQASVPLGALALPTHCTRAGARVCSLKCLGALALQGLLTGPAVAIVPPSSSRLSLEPGGTGQPVWPRRASSPGLLSTVHTGTVESCLINEISCCAPVVCVGGLYLHPLSQHCPPSHNAAPSTWYSKDSLYFIVWSVHTLQFQLIK